MNRRYRLSGSVDFQRVRRTGKAYAHPLVILMTCPNGMNQTRFGVTAGRRIGNAVRRNRAKRLLREAVRRHVDHTHAGWDVVLIARPDLLTAPADSLAEALGDLMQRAGCLVDSNEGSE